LSIAKSSIHLKETLEGFINPAAHFLLCCISLLKMEKQVISTKKEYAFQER